MYIPTSFKENRSEILHDLIFSKPLGILITSGISGLMTSPVPFILYPDEGSLGVLRAHLSVSNTHWQDLTKDMACLIIFQGEQGYISPSWYPSKALTHKTVPTWNYVAVEVKGNVHVIHDAVWLHHHLKDLSMHHEAKRPQPWHVSDAPSDFIEAQLKGIVGIEIIISSMEGKWKVSQNRTQTDQNGVIEGLSLTADPHQNNALAALMKMYRKE